MTSAELFGFILVLAAAAAVPGPDIAAIVARALGSGFVKTLPVIFGIVIGHSVWMVAALVGLAALAQMLGTLFLVLKIAGVIYLLYLAWQLWSAPAGDIGSVESDPASTRAGLATGLFVSFSNPKALVFFSAVVPSVLPVQKLGTPDIVLIVTVSAVTMVAIFCVWATVVARARAALMSASRRRALNRTSAVVMAGTGIAIATR